MSRRGKQLTKASCSGFRQSARNSKKIEFLADFIRVGWTTKTGIARNVRIPYDTPHAQVLLRKRGGADLKEGCERILQGIAHTLTVRLRASETDCNRASAAARQELRDICRTTGIVARELECNPETGKPGLRILPTGEVREYLGSREFALTGSVGLFRERLLTARYIECIYTIARKLGGTGSDEFMPLDRSVRAKRATIKRVNGNTCARDTIQETPKLGKPSGQSATQWESLKHARSESSLVNGPD